MKRQAIFMVGAPNSGKSTYIDEHDAYSNFKIISRDDMVMRLANTKKYDDAWKLVDQKEVDKELRKDFEHCIANGHHFVIDMTNMSKKSRKKWIDGINKELYELRAIVFRTPLETLLERNKQRTGKFIPEHVIRAMFEAYEEPTMEEGFVEVFYV